MKKIFLLMGLAIAMMVNAQVLEVASVEKLAIPEGDVKVAGIAPDGSYILLTTNSNNGLRKYDLTTGETLTISEAAGAGYNAQIADNGQKVIFRETSFDAKRLRQQALRSRTLATGEQKTLVKATRSPRQLAQAHNVATARPTCSIENQQLMLTIGATTKQLSPCGTDKSYIWPSVSPNGKKVLFYVSGMGAFVCNLDGQNVQFLGHDLRAPKWYNDQIVIGMNDRDNGEVTTSSEIVAVTLDGQKQVLTSGIDAMYPYACDGKIVCSGLAGETYLINIK